MRKRETDEYFKKKKEKQDKIELEKELWKQEMKDKNIVCWPFFYSVYNEKKAEQNRFEEWKKEQLQLKVSAKEPLSKEKEKEKEHYQSFSNSESLEHILNDSELEKQKKDNYNLTLQVKHFEELIERSNKENCLLQDLLNKKTAENDLLTKNSELEINDSKSEYHDNIILENADFLNNENNDILDT